MWRRKMPLIAHYSEARRPVSKQDLEWLIYEHECVLIGITETKQGDLHDWNVETTKYNLFRKDEAGKKNGKRHFISKVTSVPEMTV